MEEFSSKPRVILADDNREMSDAVRSILEPDYEIIDVVGDGASLVQAERSHEPDAAIVDISMPGMNGINAVREIKKRGSGAIIIFLTVEENSNFVRAAFDAGASAYVIKRQMAFDLRSAMNEAFKGRRFISQACAQGEDLRKPG